MHLSASSVSLKGQEGVHGSSLPTSTHLKDRQAMWVATRDAEHAVSTLALGPRRPYT